jgi:hypothetical protein
MVPDTSEEGRLRHPPGNPTSSCALVTRRLRIVGELLRATIPRNAWMHGSPEDAHSRQKQPCPVPRDAGRK